MQTTRKKIRIANLCQQVIARRLGDISGFPAELVQHVAHIYHEFIKCYLNVLRQKEGKTQDWAPRSLTIEPALVDAMRHFFCDYQHVARAYLTLNRQMDQLRTIDKAKQPNLYRHKVAAISSGAHR